MHPVSPPALRSLDEPPSSLREAPGFLARRLHQAYVALWSQHVGTSITGPQYAVLVAVRERPRTDQRSLSAVLALDRSTMADVASRLEEKGWLSRTTDGTDGRRKLLALTEAGLAQLTLSEVAVGDLEAKLWGSTTGQERSDLTRQLRELADDWARLLEGR